jgi:hypothetical protein
MGLRYRDDNKLLLPLVGARGRAVGYREVHCCCSDEGERAGRQPVNRQPRLTACPVIAAPSEAHGPLCHHPQTHRASHGEDWARNLPAPCGPRSCCCHLMQPCHWCCPRGYHLAFAGKRHRRCTHSSQSVKVRRSQHSVSLPALSASLQQTPPAPTACAWHCEWPRPSKRSKAGPVWRDQAPLQHTATPLPCPEHTNVWNTRSHRTARLSSPFHVCVPSWISVQQLRSCLP